jgi:hypothetical protein
MTKKQLALNKILFCFDYDGVNYRQTLFWKEKENFRKKDSL